MYKITQEKLDFIENLFVYKKIKDCNGNELDHYVFSENVPQNIIDKIILDDDWIIEESCYRFGMECAESFVENAKIGEYEDLDDIFDNVRDSIDADVYTSDLTEWLNENNGHVYFLTEVLEECDCKDGFELLMAAQIRHKEEIYSIIFNMLEEYLKVDEEE